MSERCSAKNRNGKPCGAWCSAGKDKCGMHLDPGLAAKMGSKHGRRAGQPPHSDAVPMKPPKTAGEVRDALANTMAQVHNRKMDTRTATTLAYLATSLLRAIEVSDLENRLEALETEQRREQRSTARDPAKRRQRIGGVGIELRKDTIRRPTRRHRAGLRVSHGWESVRTSGTLGRYSSR
jgi:hypothetical protein